MTQQGLQTLACLAETVIHLEQRVALLEAGPAYQETDWVTTNEAGRLLNLGSMSLYKLRSMGRLEARTRGRRLYFSIQSINAYRNGQ